MCAVLGPQYVPSKRAEEHRGSRRPPPWCGRGEATRPAWPRHAADLQPRRIRVVCTEQSCEQCASSERQNNPHTHTHISFSFRDISASRIPLTYNNSRLGSPRTPKPPGYLVIRAALLLSSSFKSFKLQVARCSLRTTSLAPGVCPSAMAYRLSHGFGDASVGARGCAPQSSEIGAVYRCSALFEV